MFGGVAKIDEGVGGVVGGLGVSGMVVVVVFWLVVELEVVVGLDLVDGGVEGELRREMSEFMWRMLRLGLGSCVILCFCFCFFSCCVHLCCLMFPSKFVV